MCIINESIEVPYIRITKYRKKEIIQNLIQHEIGKDLKQINGKHHRSKVGRLSLLLAADSLSSWTRLGFVLVLVMGHPHNDL